MPAALIKRLSNLLCVKSIVTLILSVVIAFYFGTQSERLSGQLEKDTGQKLS